MTRLISFLTALLLLPGWAVAAVEPADQPAAVCEWAAMTAAKEAGVPEDILATLTLTETGRRRNGVVRPWAWSVNSEGAGSWFDGIGSWLGGLFRAEGGPVEAGQPYIVGERGPEWFVPDRGGTLLPNGMAPGGPVVHQTINIDARGADAGVEARLRLLAGQIARQASAMTLDAIRRGGSAYETVRG